MKQLTCEMCGSSDLIKQDGVFVCQTCGCKYSVEEARKMMVEGMVTINKSEDVENYKKMMFSAYDNRNYNETLEYANKILEIDNSNYWAFFCKGTAVAWKSSISMPRIDEAQNYWLKALELAPENEDDDLGFIYDSIILQGRSVYSYFDVAKDKAALEKLREKFFDFQRALLADKISFTLKLADRVSSEWTAKHYEDDSKTFFLSLDDAKRKVDELANDCYGSARIFKGEWCDSVHRPIGCFALCGSFVYYLDNSDIDEFERYLKKEIENFWNIFSSNGYKQYEAAFKKMINDWLEQLEKMCKNLRDRHNKEQSEKKKKKEEKRINEYWENHKEEKDNLESEKADLESKLNNIKKQYYETNDKINNLRKQRDAETKEDADYKAHCSFINNLVKQRDECGLFKAKGKKNLQDRIDQEMVKESEIKRKAELARKEHNESFDKQIDELKLTNTQLSKELAKITSRVDEINKILRNAGN